MFHNLLLRISDIARVAINYLVNLYANEWLFRLLTYITIIITILIPVVSFIRYLARISNKFPEEPKYQRHVIRDFTRLIIEDQQGLAVKHFQEIEYIPKMQGITSSTWTLETDGTLNDFCVYPGTIRSVYEELGKTYVVHDFKNVLKKGRSFYCNISYTAHNAYTRTNEYYSANVYNPTKILSIEIIFPSDRLPNPQSLHVIAIRGTPVYTDKVKPKISETEKGLIKITWIRKRVNPGNYRIVWDW